MRPKLHRRLRAQPALVVLFIIEISFVPVHAPFDLYAIFTYVALKDGVYAANGRAHRVVVEAASAPSEGKAGGGRRCCVPCS